MTTVIGLSDRQEGKITAVLRQVRQRPESEPASTLLPLIRDCARSEEIADAMISAIHAKPPLGWWLLAGHWQSSPERRAQNITTFLTMHLHHLEDLAAKKLVDRALRGQK